MPAILTGAELIYPERQAEFQAAIIEPGTVFAPLFSINPTND
jgi:hypothetical protein